MACFVGVPGAASPPDNFHHHTDMICEWAGSKNSIMTYGLDAHQEAYQTTGIKPGQKNLSSILYTISDPEQLKKAQERFKLETFEDYFQYYYLMIIFQYLYQYRIVRFLINDVLYSRKCVIFF